MSKGAVPSGGRKLTVNVKTARKRSPASAEWLRRQLNDPYVVAAKQQGWRSRAAFKLLELDDRFHVIQPRCSGCRSGCGAGWLDAGRDPARGGRGGGRRSVADGSDPRRDAVFRATSTIRTCRTRLAAVTGWQGRSRAVRHGSEHDRACGDRPSADHGSGRAGRRLRAGGAGSGRLVRGEGVSRAARSGRCWKR